MFGSSTSVDFSKWSTFWQWKHVWLKAGHWDCPAGSPATPLPWNVSVNSTGSVALEVSAA